MIELRPPFSQLWRDKDPFIEITKLSGKVFREVKQRKCFNFNIANGSYFIKIHHGTTLKEIFKNLLSFRMPVLDAKQEWDAIHKLKQADIGTMTGVAFGRKGLNPLTRTSFIITEDLNPAISLEDFCSNWQNNPPTYHLKKQIITEVATMTYKMHQAGVNHRDYYICHFLLDLNLYEQCQQIKLSIIDLHRAQIRKQVPLRWRNKDLIGLYFSSLNIGLTNRDYFRFLKLYFKKPLKTILQDEHYFLNIVERKAEKIRVRTERKGL